MSISIVKCEDLTPFHDKVLVAMSGGVDSSTAVALLKEEGFQVAGATMIFKGVQEEDINFARRCCELLGIEFFTFDFTKNYQEEILDNFINEYKSGKTPNPCVICNQLIKFGSFMKQACDLDFDKMATGHYARVEKEKDHFLLKRGRDRNEQSYFLYRLSQDQLSKIFLPLGGYTKSEVRKIATKLKLPTALRKKSQDVCFLPDGGYGKYLSGILPENPGPIFDGNGRKVGEHKGIFFYTYGQRRGMGISHKRPYYVTKIDATENAIYVGEKEDVYKHELIAAEVNFISPVGLQKPIRVQAKSRYFAPLADATIEQYPSADPTPLMRESSPSHSSPLMGESLPRTCFGDKGGSLIRKIKVSFSRPQWALTPGQSVVFYQKDTVLGGGIIEQVLGSNLHT